MRVAHGKSYPTQTGLTSMFDSHMDVVVSKTLCAAYSDDMWVFPTTRALNGPSSTDEVMLGTASV